MRLHFTRTIPVAIAIASIGFVGTPVLAQYGGGSDQGMTSAAVDTSHATMDGTKTPVTFMGAAVRDSHRSRPVRIVLERWSTEAERNKVVAAFASDATPQELAKQFGEMEAIGSFRTISGQSNPIRYAREYTDDTGTRRLMLLTDEQIAFWKGASAAGTLDGSYTLMEVRFGGDVEGEGKFTHEAGTADAAAGRVMIEDYDDKVVGLIGIQKVGEDFSMDIS